MKIKIQFGKQTEDFISLHCMGENKINSVSKVKDLINTIKGLNSEHYHLMIRGQIMNDEDQVFSDEIGVENGSTFEILLVDQNDQMNDLDDTFSPVSPMVTELRRQPSGRPYPESVLEGDLGKYRVIHRTRPQRQI